MRIYTRAGDDGTTGLYFGGRVRKDDASIALNGTVDEAQAFLGLARSSAPRGGPLDELLVTVERDLWVLMAEVATAPDNRRKLVGGKSLVTEEMVARLEGAIDDLAARTELPTEFVVPGDDPIAASLDVARTVVRRAERLAVQWHAEGSLVPTYLNRLSDLVWAAARWHEGDVHRTTKSPSGDR
ncbi:MAG TPA: cob(I)yrinic acid a,c-diamide adenosyltransferase [Acidimicrobiales bacterium]|jgi:cob(I)alamin adenosyltransferase|nr:cob(I)yrinic acid a,c-diamide adenosyltransferase [Acidimicrobiales bacterium]